LITKEKEKKKKKKKSGVFSFWGFFGGRLCPLSAIARFFCLFLFLFSVFVVAFFPLYLFFAFPPCSFFGVVIPTSYRHIFCDWSHVFFVGNTCLLSGRKAKKKEKNREKNQEKKKKMIVGL
jgi:hypothetical protein